MTSIEWGPAIEKGSYAWPADQRQPEWVMNEDSKEVQAKNGWGSWLSVAGNASLSAWSWGHIPAIRLPVDHWAYRAIEKGFVPWAGGDAAPADWDGDDVLLRNGTMVDRGAARRMWMHGSPGGVMSDSDTIGYRRKDALRKPDDIGKYKLVARMTLAEAEREARASVRGMTAVGHYVRALRDLDLIREPTKAERVAEQTGVDVATVQRILDAADE